MYDLLGQRKTAIDRYSTVQRLAPGSDDARTAERYLKHTFASNE